jgi:hypothetical protein
MGVSPRASASSPQLTLDKLREASTKKVHGRLRGKSNADLKTTSNPLYGTAALDLEEMVREREERTRAKQERREARRIRREERRRRKAEAGLDSSSPDTSGEISVVKDDAASDGGNRSGTVSPARSPTPSRDRRSPHSPRATASRSNRKSNHDRDSITFAAVDQDATPSSSSSEKRRGSEGTIPSSPSRDSIDKKRTEEKEEEKGEGESTTQPRRGRLRRASSLRVSSGSLILGRSSDKKDKDKEKDKDKDKDKIRKSDTHKDSNSSSSRKEEDNKLHRRKGGSFIKLRGSRDDIDEVGGGRERGQQSPEQPTTTTTTATIMRLPPPQRELQLAEADCSSGDKSKRKRNLTPHSVALPIAQRMSVGVRSRAATLDVVDSSADEGDAPPPSQLSSATTHPAATTAGGGKPTTRTDS